MEGSPFSPPPSPGLWGQPPHPRVSLAWQEPLSLKSLMSNPIPDATQQTLGSLSPRPPAERGSQHLRQRTPNSRAGACFARQPQVWASPALGLPPSPHPLNGATEPSLAHGAPGLLLPAVLACLSEGSTAAIHVYFLKLCVSRSDRVVPTPWREPLPHTPQQMPEMPPPLLSLWPSGHAWLRMEASWLWADMGQGRECLPGLLEWGSGQGDSD